MFRIIDKTKEVPEIFMLNHGDIVITRDILGDEEKFLVIYDGLGNFYFINLANGQIVSKDINNAYKISHTSLHWLGKYLFKTISLYKTCRITGVIKNEDVKITVEY